MFTIKGKYNTANVYADVYEPQVIDQITSIVNHPASVGGPIAIMPDTHSGKGSVIGYTQVLGDRVCPNIVGVDIGCRISVYKLAKRAKIDFNKLDACIHTYVPSGSNVHHLYYSNEQSVQLIEQLRCRSYIGDVTYYHRSIGTLGGGNHFIEIDVDDCGNYYLVIHTGSRSLGCSVCNYYMRTNNMLNYFSLREEKLKLINRLKGEKRYSEIQTRLVEIDRLSKIMANDTKINDPLNYITGENMRDYLHDVDIVQKWAAVNHAEIASTILDTMKWDVVDQFSSIHNYIDVENNIIRKGAIAANKGQKIIVPINMAFGSLICTGKGNAEMNMSAPHGAGRLMSRTAAREQITMQQFERSMQGIYSTCVDEHTIDEAPMAYKPFSAIEHYLSNTATIDNVIKPVYNFKAHD